jgi:hypothetical protein
VDVDDTAQDRAASRNEALNFWKKKTQPETATVVTKPAASKRAPVSVGQEASASTRTFVTKSPMVTRIPLTASEEEKPAAKPTPTPNIAALFQPAAYVPGPATSQKSPRGGGVKSPVAARIAVAQETTTTVPTPAATLSTAPVRISNTIYGAKPKQKKTSSIYISKPKEPQPVVETVVRSEVGEESSGPKTSSEVSAAKKRAEAIEEKERQDAARRRMEAERVEQRGAGEGTAPAPNTQDDDTTSRPGLRNWGKQDRALRSLDALDASFKDVLK